MTELVRVANLNAGYGNMQVIFDVNMTLLDGEITILLGNNGAGKTTLLRCLLGLLTLKSGEITFKNKDITGLRTDRRIRRGMSYMSEVGIFGDLSVGENLSLGGYALPRSERHSRLMELYEEFPMLRERRDHRASSLSGGQRKMLGFAKALMSRPDLLVLDEPSSGLAPRIVLEIIDVLRRVHAKEGLSVLVAEQNVQFLDLAHRGYVMDGGAMVSHGDIETLKGSDIVLKSYFGLGE